MKKFYIIKKTVTTGKLALMEEVSKKNLKEAKSYATTTYFFNKVDPTKEQLIVVGESGFNQYYKDNIV